MTEPDSDYSQTATTIKITVNKANADSNKLRDSTNIPILAYQYAY